MVLNASEIRDLIEQGVITNTKPDLVNASSLDVTLGCEILVERPFENIVSLKSKHPLDMRRVRLEQDGQFLLTPSSFILACTEQKFNLPNDLCAEYKLKSSLGRIGLEHMNAGWCDPGWHGSVLTLEFKNLTEYHTIILHPGDRIGQVVFFRTKPVDYEDSYASKGRYNNDSTVTGVKK